MTRNKAQQARTPCERESISEGPAATFSASSLADIRRGTMARSTLAIQLALDPSVRSFQFVSSLALTDQAVPVQMLVADTNGGRVAFDIVDDRPERDLDEDGLLLIALQRHKIGLVEIDSATIGSDPRGSNCRNIWRHRDRRVNTHLIAAVERALDERSELTIRDLGDVVGLRHPMPTVCALICQRRLETDLDQHLTLRSVVRRLGHSHHPALLTASREKIGARD